MKFLDTVNYTIMKFGKCMLVIFAIKFLLFGGAFVIQSCQNDDIHKDSEKQSAVDKFMRMILLKSPDYQGFF